MNPSVFDTVSFTKIQLKKSAQQNVASFLLERNVAFLSLIEVYKRLYYSWSKKYALYPRTFFWHHVCDVANFKNARGALPFKMAQPGFVFFLWYKPSA